MSLTELARAALVIAIGLILGSVLPADVLARRRGIDIRSSGDGNPGLTNAIHVLGWAPGLITAVYDVSVGVVSLEIALLLGASNGVAYLAGIASIVGHRFPVFRMLRGGGEGMAASAGLVLYAVGVAVSKGWISFLDLGVLVAILLIIFAWSRSDVVAAIVVLPLFVIRLMLTPADVQFLAFATAATAHIWFVQIVALRHPLAGAVHETGAH